MGDDWWFAKFARNEDVSSVFDFSKKGRRMTEGPPDMILLGQSDLPYCVRVVDYIRRGQYELHGELIY